MVLACVVRGCTNKTGNAEQGVSYHIFPKDETRRKQWTDALTLFNWTPVKKSVVCSKHFLDTQFVNDASRNRKLKRSAVPCVFPKPDFDLLKDSFSQDETTLRELENALHALTQKADYVNGLMAERRNLELPCIAKVPAAQYANHVNSLLAERKILQSQTKPPGDQCMNTVTEVKKTKRKKLKSKVTEVPAAKCTNHVSVKPAPRKPSSGNQGPVIVTFPSTQLHELMPASLTEPPYRLLYSVTENYISYQTLRLRTPTPWPQAGTYENRGYVLNIQGMPRRSIWPLPLPYIIRDMDTVLKVIAQTEVPSAPIPSPNDEVMKTSLRDAEAAQADHRVLQAVPFEKTPSSPNIYNSETIMNDDDATQVDYPYTMVDSFEKTLSSPKSEDPKTINNDSSQVCIPDYQAVSSEKTLSSSKSEDLKTFFNNNVKTHHSFLRAIPPEKSLSSPKSEDLKIFFNDAAQINTTNVPPVVPYEKNLSSVNSEHRNIFFNDALQLNATYVPQMVRCEKRLSSTKSEDLKICFNDAAQIKTNYVPQIVPHEKRLLSTTKSEDLNIFFNNAAQLNATHVPQVVQYEKRLSSAKSEDLKIYFNDAAQIKTTYVPQTVPYEKRLSSSEDLNTSFNDAAQLSTTHIPQVVSFERRLAPNSEITKTVRSVADDESPRKILLKQEISSLKEKNKLLEKIVDLLEVCKRLDKKHIAYLKETIRFGAAEKQTFFSEEETDFCPSPEFPENENFYLAL